MSGLLDRLWQLVDVGCDLGELRCDAVQPGDFHRAALGKPGNRRQVRRDFAAPAIAIELAKERFVAKAPGIEILGRRRDRRARWIALMELVEDRWRTQPLLEAFV